MRCVGLHRVSGAGKHVERGVQESRRGRVQGTKVHHARLEARFSPRQRRLGSHAVKRRLHMREAAGQARHGRRRRAARTRGGGPQRIE